MRIPLPYRLVLVWVLTTATAFAVDKSVVPEKWHTPFDLYLSAREAYGMKTQRPDEVLFIDVRTQAEVRYVGIADQVDANIPYRFDSLQWRDKSDGVRGLYRRPINEDFAAAVANALHARDLDETSPVIIMCTSSSRAPHAAQALYDAGFREVHIQVEGFEGVKAKSGPDKGRRVVAGWKHEGLPWSYELITSKMYFNFDPARRSDGGGTAKETP